MDGTPAGSVLDGAGCRVEPVALWLGDLEQHPDASYLQFRRVGLAAGVVSRDPLEREHGETIAGAV